MSFHAPTGFTKEKYSIRITCTDLSVTRERAYMAAAGKYRFPDLQASKDAVWRIELEGCVVYHAPIPSTSGLVIG